MFTRNLCKWMKNVEKEKPNGVPRRGIKHPKVEMGLINQFMVVDEEMGLINQSGWRHVRRREE